MSSGTLERIIQDLDTLTADERRELLAHLEREERTAELRRIQRKYAGVKRGSEVFASRKANEIDLEDRPRR